MNLNIKIITRTIFTAIAASALLVIAGITTAEDPKSTSKSPEPAPTDIRKEFMERAEKEKAAEEKEANKLKKQLHDFHHKEWTAQNEKFRKEREQREVKEKAEAEKAQKDSDKSSD